MVLSSVSFNAVVHIHEDEPRRGYPEPEVKLHPEPEEGGLQDLHFGDQRQPGQHFAPGWPPDGQPPFADENNRGEPSTEEGTSLLAYTHRHRMKRPGVCVCVCVNWMDTIGLLSSL